MLHLQRHALVAELLATLEADGQSFGTGAHLRIGELLQNLPEDTTPKQLKTMLAPVLCTTKEEQERFYQLFERTWQHVEAIGVLDIETEDDLPFFSPVTTCITPWAGLVTALVLIGLWGVGQWTGSTSNKEIPIAFHTFSTTVGDPEQSLQIDSLVQQSQTPGRQNFRVEPLSKFSAKTEAGYAGLRLDSQANRIYYSGLKEGSDTVWLRAHPHGWPHTQMWRHQIVFSVYPPPDTSKKEEAPPDTALYVQRPIPHPRDLSQLEAPQPTALQQFMLDWEWPLKVAAMLLAGLLVWFAARLWERNRRKLIAEHRPNQKPPYAWDIQLKNPPKVDLGDRFHRLLNQLRRREADENWRLDVPRTLRATIAKGGVPQFRFAQQTRPSEYLLLIDRHSPRNHQAQLFDLMFRGFRNQEVLLERFWYDGDPRLCWNEAFPAGLDPRSLQYHYPQSRILLFGDAEQLLNPETGRLSKWATQTFSAWQDRAVLSPKPLNAWGRREHALQELFHVLPVSLSALEVAIERFETDVEKDVELDPRRFPDAAHAPIQLIDNDLIKTLEHYFGLPALPAVALAKEGHLPAVALAKEGQLPTWIAACAVYPELHWDMTLYLGELLSDSNASLLTADNIAQICRMPWFTEGAIPLEARKMLIAWLEREQPETLHQIREGIHRLLAQNPPPEDSAAHDAYAMNMALNEWLYTKDSARKKELEKDILRRIAAGQAADFMVLKILEGPRSPEEFEVPENWRKLLKQKGLARTTRKSWVWALPLWVLLCVGVVGWKPEEVGCKGFLFVSQGKELCAENVDELLQVNEIIALAALEVGDLPEADSMTANLLTIGTRNRWINGSFGGDTKPKNIDSVTFFQNLAVGYFNRGVVVRDSAVFSEIQNKVRPGLGPRAREAEMAGCPYFYQAQALNALLPDTAQLWYVWEAARVCYHHPINSTEKSNDLNEKSAEEGIYSTVNISIGFGLGGRKVLDRGPIGKYPSPKKGMVMIDICVDSLGNVLGPNPSLAIDNYKDNELLNIALRVAKTFHFEPSSKQEECGTITFNFIYKVLISTPAIVDRDGDGVPDVEDKCPDEKGGKPNGCPEQTYMEHTISRGDYLEKIAKMYSISGDKLRQMNNMPDKSEEVLLIGQKLKVPYSDLDKDGVPDSEDKCLDEMGPKENGGCPTSTQTISDRDSDGVPDAEDSCPDAKGTIYGCPPGTLFREHRVSQGETLRSIAAKYKLEIGALAQANGLEVRESVAVRKVLLIPIDKEVDRDGDGVPDVEDKCPDEKGGAPDGCPEQKYMEHTVLRGEYLYKISRKYAITEDKLRQMNNIPIEGDVALMIGQKLKVPYYDLDKDGVPDSEDICPDEKGAVENAGCPESVKDKRSQALPICDGVMVIGFVSGNEPNGSQMTNNQIRAIVEEVLVNSQCTVLEYRPPVTSLKDPSNTNYNREKLIGMSVKVIVFGTVKYDDVVLDKDVSREYRVDITFEEVSSGKILIKDFFNLPINNQGWRKIITTNIARILGTKK